MFKKFLSIALSKVNVTSMYELVSFQWFINWVVFYRMNHDGKKLLIQFFFLNSNFNEKFYEYS